MSLARRSERSTKYFFNLGKRNYNRKVISELENENGEVISNEEIEHYYSNLYSSKINLSEETPRQFTEDLELPQLSNEESEKLVGPITFEECRTILASFEKDKSPGEDGYTVEFYLAFFDLASHAVVFRRLVSPPPHKRLLTQAPHSFPIV